MKKNDHIDCFTSKESDQEENKKTQANKDLEIKNNNE